MIDFELEPHSGRIADVVLRFLGSNLNYLQSKAGAQEIDEFDFVSVAYEKLNQKIFADKADERRVTIEVQAGEHIPFKNGALLAIFVHISLLDMKLINRIK